MTAREATSRIPGAVHGRVLLATVLVLPAWLWPADRNQALESRLGSPAGSYSLEAGGFLPALLKIAADFQLPMGIQYVKKPAGASPVARSWSESNILEVLQDLVRAQDGYTLQVSNGVVHVAPSAWRGDPGDILNARIGPFEVKNDYVRFAAFRLAYVARRTMEPRPDLVEWAGTFSTGSGDRRVMLALQKPTVRDVLDELCLAADLKIWIVAYNPSPTKTTAGFRRTAALFGDDVSDLPDQQQPYWTFLLWGQTVQVRPNGLIDPVRLR